MPLNMRMISFPTNMCEAAQIFTEFGYHLSAWPRKLGKHIVSQHIPFWWNYSYPYHLINDNMNMGINHLLSKTCCLDVDNRDMSEKIFNFLGIKSSVLINETMSWQGSLRGYKCLFKSPLIEVDWLIIRTPSTPSVLELRHGNFDLTNSDSMVTIYDLVPPSLHPSGIHYEFLTDPLAYKDLPNLPDKLLELYQDKELQNKIYSILT